MASRIWRLTGAPPSPLMPREPAPEIEATIADVNNAPKSLGLEVPPDLDVAGMDEMDTFNEADFSWRPDGSPAGELEQIVADPGVYLQSPADVEDVHGVAGLEADDVVRMDVARSS